MAFDLSDSLAEVPPTIQNSPLYQAETLPDNLAGDLGAICQALVSFVNVQHISDGSPPDMRPPQAMIPLSCEYAAVILSAHCGNGGAAQSSSLLLSTLASASPPSAVSRPPNT